MSQSLGWGRSGSGGLKNGGCDVSESTVKVKWVGMVVLTFSLDNDGGWVGPTAMGTNKRGEDGMDGDETREKMPI